MINKTYIFFLFLSFGCCFLGSCQKEPTTLETVASFPKELKELSGIIEIENKLYLVEDSNNEAVIWVFHTDGTLSGKIEVKGFENRDWEALTRDEEGNLYIGDFGNNDSDRKDLRILKINKKELNRNEVVPSQVTTFNYPEQKHFPPKKKKKSFDAEAFIVKGDVFWLFTKNKNGISHVYQIPNRPGNFKAILTDTLALSVKDKPVMVTDAAFNTRTQTLVLLGHSVLFTMQLKTDRFPSEAVTSTVKLNTSQKEGICFGSNETLFMVDERVKKKGGNLYRLKLKAEP
ncbi:hypothetical protein DI487_10075 [Flavobacterium sediminis]|uniref:SdiA-regulated family protein n=1 Tax=Flavobacterium sediminis TaxID=2201181 RepID=A0A2U8QVR1_9FLAO|nr:hypothetical protein [Flavobacterium sediminis]AWM14159.1 hypothetical protein DI487_10075 [Flavobacterium sediminis]